MERINDTDLERARKRLCEIKRQELIADERIDAINEHIEALESAREETEQLKDQLLEEHLESAIMSYCTAWNLPFFDRMRACLPRELRNMIYAQLWDPVTLQETWYRMMMPSRFESSIDGEHQPHFTKPAFVGPEAALEVVETWYHLIPSMPGFSSEMVYNAVKGDDIPNEVAKSPFTASSLEQAERLVHADAFRVGLDPATLLRELALEVNITRLVLHRYDSGSPKRYLDLLLGIKKKAGFKLMIRLQQRHIRMNLWPEAFDIFRPIVEAFEEQGANVLIYFRYDNRKYPAVQINLGHALKNPESNWRHDIAAFFDLAQHDHRIWWLHRDYRTENNTDYEPADPSDRSLWSDDWEYQEDDIW